MATFQPPIYGKGEPTGPAYPGPTAVAQGLAATSVDPFGLASSTRALRRLSSLANEERLRFLREQLRKGRLASVLSVTGGSPGQGFQLGRKSVLGE